MKALSAAKITEMVQGELVGDTEQQITGIAALDNAESAHLSFLSNKKYTSLLNTTKASVVLIPKNCDVQPSDSQAFVKCQSSSIAFSIINQFFNPPVPQPKRQIHPSAVIDESVELGENLSIGPHVVVEQGARISDNCIIGAGSYIGHDTQMGESCHVYPNVTIHYGTIIGDNVIIHSGAVIADDGFGFEPDPNGHKKIPQLGNVILESNVDIGSNCCIDRARFGSTIIKQGAKIDNLVQIAHNVVFGELSFAAAQVGIAGSSEVGKLVQLAGQVGIPGHLKIGDGSTLMGKSMPISDVEAGKTMCGSPAADMKQYFKQVAYTKKLPELSKSIKELEKNQKSQEG